jgi:hypothetical protein
MNEDNEPVHVHPTAGILSAGCFVWCCMMFICTAIIVIKLTMLVVAL